MASDPQPKAREGLLSTDHSKRGKRFVTIVDPESLRVTLLEGWEHEILLLCDGRRTIEEITELLSSEVDELEIDYDGVVRCLKFFERQSLVYSIGLRKSDLPPPGPQTMANLQEAFAEWHKEPLGTGQAPFPDALDPPFPTTGANAPAGLDPTVALPDDELEQGKSRSMAKGATLVLAGAESILDGGPEQVELSGGGGAGPNKVTEVPTRAGRFVDDDEDDDQSGFEAVMDAIDLPEEELNVLAAVDDVVALADQLQRRRELTSANDDDDDPFRTATSVDQVLTAEAVPPRSKQHRIPSRTVEVADELKTMPIDPRDASVFPPVKAEAEVILNPTRVGLPPPERDRKTDKETPEAPGQAEAEEVADAAEGSAGSAEPARGDPGEPDAEALAESEREPAAAKPKPKAPQRRAEAKVHPKPKRASAASEDEATKEVRLRSKTRKKKPEAEDGAEVEGPAGS